MDLSFAQDLKLLTAGDERFSEGHSERMLVSFERLSAQWSYDTSARSFDCFVRN